MKIKFPSFLKKNKLEDTNTNFDKELEQFVAKRISADDLNGNALSHENELLKKSRRVKRNYSCRCYGAKSRYCFSCNV